LLWRFVDSVRNRSRFKQVPEPDEILCRFIFSRAHFVYSSRRVKGDAFLPTKKPPRETSVSRIVGLKDHSVWRIGEAVAQTSQRVLHARGDVLAKAVFAVGLEIRPDNKPKRHAAIVGWPEEKDRQIMLAQRIAEAAELHERNTTP
jgi:hypothetical protein